VHPRTLATLDQLENADWFSRVGVKDAAIAIVLSSWEEAIAHSSSLEWENLRLEAANQYCEHLSERSNVRFERWNEVVREVKKVVVPLVQRKINAVVRTNRLPKSFEDTVNWDILHVLVESEYADVYPPGFYAGQAYWYVKGHFPCGWQGGFPGGVPIVY